MDCRNLFGGKALKKLYFLLALRKAYYYYIGSKMQDGSVEVEGRREVEYET